MMGYSIFTTFANTAGYIDPRMDVYLDFSRMGELEVVKHPLMNWNEMAVQNAIVGKMCDDFCSYEVNFIEEKGDFLQKKIVFQGENASFGLAFWVWGFVYTDSIAWQIGKYVIKNAVAVTDSQFGIAIGNVGSHELGHMYGFTSHVPFPGYIMTKGEIGDATITTAPLPWSPMVRHFLNLRFSR
jgi:hypothetical protein